MLKIKSTAKFSNQQVRVLREHGGLWLKEQRKYAGLKQKQISDSLYGMETAAYISVIENGGPNLPEDRWEDYAEILGMDWSDFCKHMLLFYKPSIYLGVYKKNPLDVIAASTKSKERAKK